MRTKDGLCSGCWKKVEDFWKVCPYCEEELGEEPKKNQYGIGLGGSNGL